MFGLRIITDKKLRQLTAQLEIKMLEVFKASFKEFTEDVVECISNNLQGFSQILSNKPCKLHDNALKIQNKSIESLRKKYLDHDKRIDQLEKDVKELMK